MEAGHEIVFVVRGVHGEAVEHHGLTLIRDGEESCFRASRVCEMRDLHGETADMVLLGLKAHQIGSVLPGLSRNLVGDVSIVPLCNGIGAEEEIAAVVGKDRVVAATVRMPARRVGLGRIELHMPHIVGLASMMGSPSERVAEVASVFSSAGFEVHVEDDYRAMLWRKAVMNAVLNPIAVLTGLDTAQQLRELRPLIRLAMGEVKAVAEADGVALEQDLVESTLNFADGSTWTAMPSMYFDDRARRPTEIESLVGVPVRLGRSHRVPTPILETLYELVRARDAWNREQA